MWPASLGLSLFTTSPLLFIIALIPLFADLKTNESLSTALNIDFEKCWNGPIESPNQPSSDILIKMLFFEFIVWISSGKIIS